MKKRIALILTTVAMASLIIAGGTLAWFSASTGEKDNKINTSGTGVNGELVDEFDEKQELKPGGSVNKNVGITSTGDMPAYGRIHVKMFWTAKGAVGTEKAEPGLEVSNEWLKTIDNSQGKWTLAETITSTANVTEYVYTYGTVLNQNETAQLFTTVELPGASIGNAYANKTLHVVVSGDLVQAENNADNPWDGFVAEEK